MTEANLVTATEEENKGLQKAEQTPSDLIAIAIKSNLDVEKMERLFALQERWEANQARKAFFEAMAKFQKDVPVITKQKSVDFGNKTGGRTSYKYADLGEIEQTIKETMQACGLSKRWQFEEHAAEIKCTCIVSHVMGHSESTTLSAAKDTSGNKNDIQARGSAATYLQRYTLIGALGLTTANEDVDGDGTKELEVKDFDPANDTISFGKHSGTKYCQLPGDYIDWMEREGRDEEKVKIKLLRAYLSQNKPAQASPQTPAAPQPEHVQGKINGNPSVIQSSSAAIKAKPGINAEQFAKAKERIAKGEDLINKILSVYCLTPEQNEELADLWEKSRNTKAVFTEAIMKSILAQESMSALNAIWFENKALHTNADFVGAWTEQKKKISLNK